MALVTWGVSVLSGLGALPRCMSDFTSWYATLGLWPNSSLNKTTHGDGTSASRLPRPIWFHTELQSRPLVKGTVWAISILQMRKVTLRKAESLPKAYLAGRQQNQESVLVHSLRACAFNP